MHAATPGTRLGTPAIWRTAGVTMERRTFLTAQVAAQLEITRFGASAEASDNGEAIQRAIDEAAGKGGGMVRIPAGRFVTGTLRLRSGVALWLDHGAMLSGSANPKAYAARRPTNRLPPDGWECAVILAENVERVAVLGHGTITGAKLERPRVPGKPREPFRPRLLSFEHCRDVRVEGVRLEDADRWTLHFYDCESVQARGLRIRAGYSMFNTDGIDIDGSRNVIVSDCDIVAGDDCVVLKTTDYLGDPKPCENVTVTNCILSTRASALKIGTETHAAFRNITFSNCSIYGEGEFRPDAICLEAVDGAQLRGVTVSNIVMRHIRTPVFVRLGARRAPSRLEDVVITGLVATDASVTSSITGIPGHAVQNVMVSGARFAMTGGGSAQLSEREIPEQIAAYPKGDMFGLLPSFGFYVRHARAVRVKDVSVNCESADARPVLVAEDVHGLTVDALEASAELRLRNVSSARLVRPQGKVRISGAASERIAIIAEPFAAPGTIVERSPEVEETAVRVIVS